MVDVYRLTGACFLLVAAWCLQVIGWGTFRAEVRNGPPRMKVIEFEDALEGEGFVERLKELPDDNGWDTNVLFVTSSEAERRLAAYKRKKWLGLIAGFVGLVGVLLVALRLWGDWLTAVACVLLGPVAVAWGIHRSNRAR
jgi:hypothetical protein